MENVKEKKYLSFEEVMDFIKEMSYSTGLYGRLYRNIMETEESQEEFKRICEQEKFEQPKACITCKLENTCKHKHEFPLDLCECCDKYIKVN